MSFPSRRFELTLPTNGSVSVCLVGTSRSGKSTLLKYLYNTYFKNHITVMTTMNPQAEIYSDLDRKIVVSHEYHPEILRDMFEINRLSDNKYPFLFISDDFVGPTIKNDAQITRALTVGRNNGLTSIFSMQGRTLLNAVGRNNANYIAIFKQQTPLEFEAVIKEFLSMYLPPGMSMREMVDFCRRATEDHQFFFIDNIEGVCYLTKLSAAQAGL